MAPVGRYDTLNPQTKDLVDALIPGILLNWNLDDITDAIPQDIRMRKWDTDRRDHIIDESENDARNWGVQFLKDLLTISRILKGQVEVFQQDLRSKLSSAKTTHPWCRLKDIKDLLSKYDGSGIPADSDSEVETGAELTSDDEFSSDDSVIEKVIVKPSKKRDREPAKVSKSSKSAKKPRKVAKRRKTGSPPPRLRRSSSASWERREKRDRREKLKQIRRDRDRDAEIYPSRIEHPYERPYLHYGGYPVKPEHGMRYLVPQETLLAQRFPMSGLSTPVSRRTSVVTPSADMDDLSIQQLQAELEVAEAELRSSRLRMAIVQKQRIATGEPAELEGQGSKEEPHVLQE